MIPTDVVLLKTQDAFSVRTDAEAPGTFVSDKIPTWNSVFRTRQFCFGTVEFVHRSSAHYPSADAETGGGRFEQVTFVFVAWQFTPAVADDFAVERRAHVADHVWSHRFQRFPFLKDTLIPSRGGAKNSSHDNKDQTYVNGELAGIQRARTAAV
jgi:hypothetical protein